MEAANAGAGAPPAPPTPADADAPALTEDAKRFLVELEFVQCLANPNYLQFLVQHSYFEKEAFVNYLTYLQYWQRPEYAKFVMYPHCLYFLGLVVNETFRVQVRLNSVIPLLLIARSAVWDKNG
jgi:hypothetical protein